MLEDLWFRLRSFLRRKDLERELEEELRHHLEQQVAKHVSRGLAHEEAYRRARIELGDMEQIREECRSVRGVALLQDLLQDVRYAGRGFRRSPGFMLTVVGTIALGLGLNTTFFTIFNAYVLKPAAVRDPYRLFEVTWENRAGQGHWFSWSEFKDLAKKKAVFDQVIGSEFLFARVEGHPMLGEMVAGNYFGVLNVGAAQGRILVPDDVAKIGAAPVVVLSYSAWQNKFGGDSRVIGKKVLFHGYPLEIVGVAQKGFNGLGTPREFWIPLTMTSQLQQGPDLFGAVEPHRLRIVVRLQPGVSESEACAALTVWARQITANRSEPERAVAAMLRSQATSVPLSPQVIAVFLPVFAAFGLVLLIACANVANMMLARAMSRQREMGVRLSLGAGRSRLVRQLLTESALLAILAAVLGFVISESTIRMGERLMFATLPHEFAQYITVLPLDPDLRVLAFMLLAAIASVLLFGLAPALQMTRSNIMQAARGEFTTEIRPSRLRNALVVIQVATCMPLLICAGVLVRAESKFAKQDIGLNIRNVLAIQIEDKARPRALARLTDTRSLESLAAATEIPLDHRLPTIPVKPAKGDHQIRAFYNSVSPSYFALFNIPLRSGRLFTDNEARNASPVAVVSSRTAYRFWPKQNPIGQTLQLLPNSSMSSTNRFARLRTVRVLGVVGDVLSGWIGDGPETTCIYFPTTVHAEGTALLARVHGNIMTAQQRLDAALNEVAPGEIDEIHPLEEILNVQLYPFRAAYWVGSSLGTLALLLTVIGIYGVLSFTVAQRTKEIGVRTALGAKPLTLVSMVFAQSLRLMGMGIGVGVAIAISVSTVFASFFTSISTYDPLSYAGGIGIIVLATGFAAYFPCRRATRISPLIALRYE